MSVLRDSAIALVREHHAGQVDKQGRDYVEHHLLPVARLLEPYGEDAYVAGLLHDIVEDTDVTLAELSGRGVPAHIVQAVDSVTRRNDEPYPRLIERAAADPLGRLVKLADNWVNLSGLGSLADEATANRLRAKYEAARAALTASLVGGTPQNQ